MTTTTEYTIHVERLGNRCWSGYVLDSDRNIVHEVSGTTEDSVSGQLRNWITSQKS